MILRSVGHERNATIIFKFDDFFLREVVEKGVRFVKMLLGGFGLVQFFLELVDFIKPLCKSSILVSIDAFLLGVS